MTGSGSRGEPCVEAPPAPALVRRLGRAANHSTAETPIRRRGLALLRRMGRQSYQTTSTGKGTHPERREPDRAVRRTGSRTLSVRCVEGGPGTCAFSPNLCAGRSSGRSNAVAGAFATPMFDIPNGQRSAPALGRERHRNEGRLACGGAMPRGPLRGDPAGTSARRPAEGYPAATVAGVRSCAPGKKWPSISVDTTRSTA
jgi:hypothetical protein